MDLYNTDYFKNWDNQNQNLNQNQTLKYNKSLSDWGSPLGDVPLAPALASTSQAPNINEEIVNENIHLDVNNTYYR